MEEEKGKVLIVDDEKNNRRILEAHLLTEGYETCEACDGYEALDKINEENPDLILLDVMMPGIDGFEVCRRIKSDSNSAVIPVIMVTVLDDRDSKVKGIDSGGDDFLTKPVDSVELKARVRSLIRMKNYYEKILEMNEKLLGDMKKAQRIQESLVPSEFPELQGVDFQALYKPAEYVGGDYLNVCRVDENNVCLYITDVSGHGLDAAMLTIFTRETIDSYIRKVQDNDKTFSPKECMENLDIKFKEGGFPEDIFITVFLALFNYRTYELKYCSSGFFEFPFVYGKNGLRRLECPGGLIISFGPPGEYLEYSTYLQDKEGIFLFTDGLVEQKNEAGEEFGKERLEKVLHNHISLKSESVIEDIMGDLRDFSNREIFDDDIALLNMYINQ